MVALSFQAQFRAPIEARLKTHTLRNPRKRDPRVGEELQLYTGMRTRHCRIIGRATCIGVLPIRIDFQHRRVEFTTSGHAVTAADTDAFAVKDGFPEGWHQMRAFWVKNHPEIEAAWDGLMIQWGDTLRLPE